MKWFSSKIERQKEVIIVFRPGDRLSLIVTDQNYYKNYSLTIQTCTAKELKLIFPSNNSSGFEHFPTTRKFHILKPSGDYLIYTEGNAASLSRETKPTLTVQHNNIALVAERRSFRRIGICKKIELIPVSASGNQIAVPRLVSVLDISPTGIGIKTRKKYSLKTYFKTKGLFIFPDHNEVCADYFYQFVWQRGNPWIKYHYGAIFTFSSQEDIRRLSSVLEKLQIMNLTQQYQQLLTSRSD